MARRKFDLVIEFDTTITGFTKEKVLNAVSWRMQGDYLIVDEEVAQEKSVLMPDEFSPVKLYTTIFYKPTRVWVEEK